VGGTCGYTGSNTYDQEKKSSIFWDITPCSSLKFNRRFGRTCLLHFQWALLAICFTVSCLAYFSTLKMEATRSSETSVGFQRIARRHIPEDRTIHNDRCEDLKSWPRFFLISHGVPFEVTGRCREWFTRAEIEAKKADNGGKWVSVVNESKVLKRPRK
jgi:hypothetical protein